MIVEEVTQVIDSLAVGSDVVVQEGQNTPEKIQFRQNVLVLQEGLMDKISKGEIESTLDDCTLTHHFSPVDEKYGCGTYAREMFIPKDTVII
jgi:hypothetical protein